MLSQYKKRTLISLAVLALILAAAEPTKANEALASTPQRIISLAPSVTEILFELGAGEKLVGVTRYCDHPPEAKAITDIGGYVDPNYEEIVSLRPDLIFLLTAHRDAKRKLEKMDLRTLTVPHKTIRDIHQAIVMIGEACGAPEKAAAKVEVLTNELTKVEHAVSKMPRPRVLICIGRDTANGEMAGMFMAGRNGFYDEIIETAGGLNAYTGETVLFPQLSAEGVIQLDPDVIIDLLSHINPNGKTREEIIRQWDQLRPVTAVRKHQVHVIVGKHALLPGPRYIQFLEQLANLLHPEAFAKESADD